MNLLIFLDLTYNRAQISNFTLSKGKISKFFLFLPITRAKFSRFYLLPGGGGGRGHMYTWSPLEVAPLAFGQLNI